MSVLLLIKPATTYQPGAASLSLWFLPALCIQGSGVSDYTWEAPERVKNWQVFALSSGFLSVQNSYQ